MSRMSTLTTSWRETAYSAAALPCVIGGHGRLFDRANQEKPMP